MKTTIIALTSVIALSHAVIAKCTDVYQQTPFHCQETVACGPTVKVQGSKVILDRNLVTMFAKDPSFDLLEKNLWEIVYFVNIADKEAISASIDLLAKIREPRQVQIDDHYGIRPLARALTSGDQFWEVLAIKPLAVRKKVIQYFDVNKSDYTFGYDYDEMKQKILSPVKMEK